MAETILVTGGIGFIGGKGIERLFPRNCFPIVAVIDTARSVIAQGIVKV